MSELKFIETTDETIYTDILEELENGVGEPLYPGDERRIFGDTMAKVSAAWFAGAAGTTVRTLVCSPSSAAPAAMRARTSASVPLISRKSGNLAI